VLGQRSVLNSVSREMIPSEVYKKYILLPLKQILLDSDALYHSAIVIRRRTTVRLRGTPISDRRRGQWPFAEQGKASSSKLDRKPTIYPLCVCDLEHDLASSSMEM
jgi:hypothetical protein